MRPVRSGPGTRPLPRYTPPVIPSRASRAVLASLLLLPLPACGGGELSGPRNLLLVVLDTTRADHLSCYGYGRATSPTVDGLAREGVLLQDAYAQSSLTPVSAGSFLTGIHPYRHGVRSLFAVAEESLAPGFATLAERLAQSGRRTAGFVSAPPMGSKYGLARGFETYSEEARGHANRLRAQGVGNAYQRRADETVAELLPWLEEHAAEPFAVLLHFFDAHDRSLVPPREFLEPRMSFPLPPEFDQRQHLAGLRDPGRRVEVYDAEIEFMDAQLARVLDALDELGVREDTLVVVLADHGEGLGQHDFWTHGLLYGEQLRVPLVLAGPGLPRGREVAARVRLVDLVPTLAELFDLGLAGDALDGESFLPWLEAEPPADAAPREVYAEVHHAEGDGFGREPEMYALTVGEWKYVHRPQSGAHELYHLAADPGELENHYDPEHPMARYLASRLAAMGAVTGAGASLEGLDEEQLEMLRRLGYL